MMLDDAWAARRMPSGLSPSSLTDYLKCPRQWAWKRVWRLPDEPGLPATTGTTVHRALELLCQLPRQERTLDTAVAIVDALLARVRAAAAQIGPPHLGDEGEDRIVDEYRIVVSDPDAFTAAVEAGVRGYYAMGADPTQLHVVSTEQRIETTLDTPDGPVPVRGIIDRIVLAPNFTEVLDDYKNGKAPHPKFGAADYQRAMQFYALMRVATGAPRPSLARLIYVTAQQVLPVPIADHDLYDLNLRLGKVWAEANAAFDTDDYATNPKALCGWCPFVTMCPPGIDHLVDLARQGRLKSTAPAWQTVPELVALTA
jgi:putative RecB family exonuclease